MTIDEAIQHCLEVAEQNETKALSIEGTIIDRVAKDCRECAADHRQLAEWLTELKEAKRLLKAAVEDFDSIYCRLGDACEPMPDCDVCPFIPSGRACNCIWRYANEALKLLND
ncbi:MAG: hypothetical protein J6S85_14130 [Methanobrevibacter sp.]|nr:hypothetical protein [Methanobrevibacter sp.]